MRMSADEVIVVAAGLAPGWMPPFDPPQTAVSAPRRRRPALSEQEQQARLAAAQAKRERRRQRLRAIAAPKPPVPIPEWSTPELEEQILREHLLEQQLRDNILREVRRLVRRRVYRDIMAFIEDCDYTSSFSIVRQPVGDLQDEGEYAFKWLYVDQYCNGGYSGDDFAGWIYIPLNAGKFLKFHYSC